MVVECGRGAEGGDEGEVGGGARGYGGVAGAGTGGGEGLVDFLDGEGGRNEGFPFFKERRG